MSRRVFKLLSHKPFYRKQLLNEYININQSRNCNLHYFTSVWGLWPQAIGMPLQDVQPPSSLKSVIVSHEVPLHSWNGLCSGEGECLKNGKCVFWDQWVAGMLLNSEVQWLWVGCEAGMERAQPAALSEGEAAAELGTSQMRWKWQSGFGLRLQKSELGGTWHSFYGSGPWLLTSAACKMFFLKPFGLLAWFCKKAAVQLLTRVWGAHNAHRSLILEAEFTEEIMDETWLC